MSGLSYYERNRDTVKARTKAYRDAHAEYYRERSREQKALTQRTAADRAVEKDRWRWKRGIHDAHVRVYRAQPRPAKSDALRPLFVLHDAHVRALRGNSAALYRWKYANDADFLLAERLRTQLRKKRDRKDVDEAIRQALKHRTSGKRISQIVGYTTRELRVHLERQFSGEMSWSTFTHGGWHIDHIVPRRLFDVSTIDGLRACGALTNLRPLEAAANLRKGGRREHLV